MRSPRWCSPNDLPQVQSPRQGLTSMEASDAMDVRYWGHCLKTKSSNMFRIMSLNIGGIPMNKDDLKNSAIRQLIASNRVDAIGLNEVNIHWKNVGIQHRLPERTRGWFPSLNLNTAYNVTEQISDGTQYGGVSLWSVNEGCDRVESSGHDPSGLGRWVWTRYRGCQGIHLRVISAYHPVENKTGPRSVWNQHATYLDDRDDARDPFQAFQQDFVQAIQQWLEVGDQLVIGMDVNANVPDCSFTTTLCRLGLRDAVTANHGMQAPRTYKRGSVPIDALYVTSTLWHCRCGYLPFDGFDHRPIYIDVPHSIAFGSDIAQTVKPRIRRCNTNDPRIVQAYLTTYKQKITEHQLLRRAAILLQDIKGPLTPAQIREYNAIDVLKNNAIQVADKKCRRVYMGQVPYSPVYNRIIEQIRYWKLLTKKMSGGKVDNKFLQRQRRIAKLEHAVVTTLDDARRQLRSARKLKATLSKQKAVDQRATFYEGLAQAKALSNNTKAEQELRNIMTREQQRRDARMIKRVNQKLRNGGLSTVMAPNETGEWMEINDKLEIEKALVNENSRRFNQARMTPFLQPPLLSFVGPLGTTTGAHDIRDGHACLPAGIDEWAMKLIPHLCQPQVVKQAKKTDLPPRFISPEQYRAGWKKAKERTSSGRSGQTFSHYMAHGQDTEASLLDVIMTNIPYQTGFSPKRWQQGINVMLEKKKGNFRVDKLRAILLFEPDFNQLNKTIGREMMFTAEKLGLLAEEQFGSRRQLTAIDHGLNKVLTFDFLRQRRQAGALCANDAKSCYDRIVHSVAKLCMERTGMHEEPIVCMFVTLQALEHHIRTVFGDSNISFSGKLWTVPIQGVGQGNGAGPAIWAVVSTPVLNLLRAEGYGAFFQAAISKTKLRFVGYAFVDDFDLIELPEDRNTSYRQVAVQMQKALDAWEGGIRATGGAIVPEKTHWYLIDFKWKAGHWQYATTDETPAEITVRDMTGQRKTLKRLEVHEAERTLGVRVAPDGNMNTEFLHLLTVAKRWADNIRTGHLPRHLVWQSMQSTVMKTMEYPLPATTMSEKQCDELMKPLLMTGLPASGINRNFPRALVFSPQRYQGLGILPLYTKQGIEHITRLMKFGTATGHLTGQLIRQSLEALKLEIGMNGPLLSQPYEIFGILATPCWIQHTWEFLYKAGLRMEDSVADLTLFREKDTLLMEMLVRKGMRGYQLKQINRCRIYLQVCSIAEITTGCGRYVTQAAWDGNRDSTRLTEYRWPNQERPGNDDWRTWRTALASCLCTTTRKLKTPLGSWLPDTHPTSWWFDPDTDRLYHLDGTAPKFYPRIAGRAGGRQVSIKYSTRMATTTPTFPTALKGATITQIRDTIILTGYADTAAKLTGPNYQFLGEFIQTTVHRDSLWAVEKLSITDNGHTIAQALIRGRQIVSVSDGSFADKHGTAAWIIQAEDGNGQITGKCITPGGASDQSAYRSELAGLFGIVTTMNALCKFHDVTTGKIILACDGLSALNNATSASDIVNPTYPQFDLVMAIRRLVQESPLQWITQHVKGHQDDQKEFHELDRLSQLNVWCDIEAGAYRRATETRSAPVNTRISGEQWSLWDGTEKICNHFQNAIIEKIHGSRGQEYWQRKGRVGDGTVADIDWDVTQHAMAQIGETRRKWVSKHSTGFCATNQMMTRWKQRSTDKCPRCTQRPETAEHVQQCQDPSATALFRQKIAELRRYLQSQETAQPIIEVICSRLLDWQSGTTFQPWRSTFPGLTDLCTKQDRMGWYGFYSGQPCVGWAAAQQMHLQFIRRRRTGKRWLSAVVRKLWDIAWDMWDHRNGIVHDKEAGTDKQQLEKDIREQYALGFHTLTSSAKPLYWRGIRTVLGMPTAAQQSWLLRVRSSRERFKRRYKDQDNPLGRQRALFRAWLGTGTETAVDQSERRRNTERRRQEDTE